MNVAPFPATDPLWFKDAVIYELHVKSFHDFNDDGVGDFRGLLGKLPYLESLGVTAVWLLPFYPSPLRDDGYDISDHYRINPDYGGMRDFKDFLKEAHRRGLRVITELVVNHTSDKHPWFQRARRAAPGSSARGYYVWSDSTEKYRDARIIFKDFETSNWAWDPVAKAYYWHRFYHHQPDLNFESPLVQKALLKVVDFWLGLGVDGLRLDAVPYLFEAEGTSCENLPATHAFLKKLRAHVDAAFKDKMLLCEANQWPEDAAAYFGDGDECHMAFHFPVMPRLFMSLWMEDSFPVTDILDQTPAIPDSCQWAVFLRNHDELTLEMVTDEERDYMYKVYARDAKARINLGIRRRLAPLLGNNRHKIELMNLLLFSLPGTPVVYYGDEIGMGDNFYLGDRYGMRTPMQWSPDRNAGFSRANPQKLFLPVVVDSEYHFEALNVECQEANLSSLLWWMKRVIALRGSFKAFGRGSLEQVCSDNPKIIAFVRRYLEEVVLVVANLSRFPQAVGLDLSKYTGYVPVEVFSGSAFPVIKDQTYLLTPGSHNAFWFQLNKPDGGLPDGHLLPELGFPNRTWTDLFDRCNATGLAAVLAGYVNRALGSGRGTIGRRGASVIGHFALPSGSCLVVLEVSHSLGRTETYLLPLMFFAGDAAAEAAKQHPLALIASLELSGHKGLLVDAMRHPAFHADLLLLFVAKKTLRCGTSVLRAQTDRALRNSLALKPPPAESRLVASTATGVSIAYGGQYLLQFCGMLDEGFSADLEVARHLATKTNFVNFPPTLGDLSLSREGQFHGTLGVLRGIIPHQSDAWTLMLGEAARYFNAVQTLPMVPAGLSAPVALCAAGVEDIPSQVINLVGAVAIEMAVLLGTRTGQLHVALAGGPADPDFAPEPMSRLDQRSTYQSMTGASKRALLGLPKRLKDLPPDLQTEVIFILENQPRILTLIQQITNLPFAGSKIRIHGHLSLNQVLFTGKDFLIKDFAGEFDETAGERRIKRSPLRDVAALLMSLYFVAHAPFLLPGELPRKDMAGLTPWIDLWFGSIGGAFLNGYLTAAGISRLLPTTRQEVDTLLRVFLADRAVAALDAEFASRQDWAIIPARILHRMLDAAPREDPNHPPRT